MRAAEPLKRYYFKEGVASVIPVKVTNKSDKAERVEFEVYFTQSADENFRYTCEIPANSVDLLVEIPVKFKDVEKIEVGNFTLTGQFENGETFRAGVDRSYEYVAEDIDVFMVDTMNAGYSDEGAWMDMDYWFDKYGRYTRLSKDRVPGSSTYTPQFLPDGKYKVILGGNYNTINDPAAEYTVNCGNESEKVTINQQGAYRAAEWELGEFDFKNGEDNFVKYTRTNYKSEAVACGVGAYVIFERIGTTDAERLQIKADYIKWRDSDKTMELDTDEVILSAVRDAENNGSTARVDATLVDGRQCIELTNGYALLHFKTTLSDGVYKVYNRVNISNKFAKKMYMYISGSKDFKTVEYDITKGKSGWQFMGTMEFDSSKPAEVWISKFIGDSGRAIADEIKFVKIK